MTPSQPAGRLVTPVAFDPSGLLLPLHVDANGQLLVTPGVIAVWAYPDVSQVLASAEAVNATVTAYTVTAGKTGYINNIYISSTNGTATLRTVNLTINNAAAAQQAIYYLTAPPNSGDFLALPFPTPIKMLAGWTIKITSGFASVYIDTTLHGWEA